MSGGGHLAFKRFSDQLDFELVEFCSCSADFLVQRPNGCFELILTLLGLVLSATFHHLYTCTFALDFVPEARDAQRPAFWHE